jgi:hypothetical protein
MKAGIHWQQQDLGARAEPKPEIPVLVSPKAFVEAQIVSHAIRTKEDDASPEPNVSRPRRPSPPDWRSIDFVVRPVSLFQHIADDRCDTGRYDVSNRCLEEFV